MMVRSIFLSATAYLLLAGCKDDSKKNSMPELASCDSAAVMYYHTPGNPRFFKLSKVYDKKTLATVAEDINGKVISSKDSCTTQGKIYFYGKGDAVYIAYFTRIKKCMTFSFIKTGEKYFVSMSADTKLLLDDLEKTAKELKTEGAE